VLENGVGHMMGSLMKLHSEELIIFTSLYIVLMIKLKMRWAEHVALMVKMRNAYNVSLRQPERKRPPGRPKHRWEDINVNFREVGYVRVD
jgi:hypothetical protein